MWPTWPRPGQVDLAVAVTQTLVHCAIAPRHASHRCTLSPQRRRLATLGAPPSVHPSALSHRALDGSKQREPCANCGSPRRPSLPRPSCPHGLQQVTSAHTHAQDVVPLGRRRCCQDGSSLGLRTRATPCPGPHLPCASHGPTRKLRHSCMLSQIQASSAFPACCARFRQAACCCTRFRRPPPARISHAAIQPAGRTAGWRGRRILSILHRTVEARGYG
mmetsp:Transcript_718/g.1950  ORF Transcript_718/g.1950 Transcript_718/m.1950 type:complete len:219 (-) Transcript_718:1312-1968(-)